ncbi:unnamed protein product, partial [Amoebophrya sp. A25]
IQHGTPSGAGGAAQAQPVSHPYHNVLPQPQQQGGVGSTRVDHRASATGGAANNVPQQQTQASGPGISGPGQHQHLHQQTGHQGGATTTHLQQHQANPNQVSSHQPHSNPPPIRRTRPHSLASPLAIVRDAKEFVGDGEFVHTPSNGGQPSISSSHYGYHTTLTTSQQKRQKNLQKLLRPLSSSLCNAAAATKVPSPAKTEPCKSPAGRFYHIASTGSIASGSGGGTSGGTTPGGAAAAAPPPYPLPGQMAGAPQAGTLSVGVPGGAHQNPPYTWAGAALQGAAANVTARDHSGPAPRTPGSFSASKQGTRNFHRGLSSTSRFYAPPSLDGDPTGTPQSASRANLISLLHRRRQLQSSSARSATARTAGGWLSGGHGHSGPLAADHGVVTPSALNATASATYYGGISS